MGNADLVIFVLVFAVVIALIGFQLTGFLIAGEASGYKNWTFSNSSEYIYNSSLVSFSENNVSLKANTTTTQYTNISVSNFNLTRALYDPEDKLEKVESLDDNRFDLEKEKTLDLVFGGNLANGNNISIYIKSGSAANISLCVPGSYCTSPEYGNTSYSGSGEGYHNITIQNLLQPTRFLTIFSSKEIKIDHVNSTQKLVGAYYNPTDKTDKLAFFDSDKFEIEKNKFFNIFFNTSLNNNYTVNFYLEGSDSANISFCQFYNCSKSYGLIQYKGSEGWFSLNLSGMENQEKQFSLNSTKGVKINYVNSSFTNVSYYNISNTTYPSSSFLETKDMEVQNLKNWDKIVFGEELKGQNISYHYSVDSGGNWTLLTGFDLSNISSKKIRFGANLTSNTTQTPYLKFLFVNYTKLNPAFTTTDRTEKASPGDVVNITLNLTNPSLVSNATAYVKHYNSTIISTVQLSFENSTGLFSGKWNSTGISTGLYYIDVEIQSLYTENLNQRQMISLIGSTRGSFLNSSLKFLENQTLRIDAKNYSSTVLDIIAKENLENVSLSISEYTKNVRSSNSKTEMGKYVDIVTDSFANSNFSSITFTVYYNETEIQQAGLNEDTLKIHYYNETSGQWVELNSVLNKTGKYLSVNLTHFSTYGVFGDVVQTSSSSGGGGGYSSSTQKPIVSIVIPITTFDQSENKNIVNQTETKENQTTVNKCDYSASIDIEKKLLKNTGNCLIDKIEVEISPNLKEFIYISNTKIENVDIGQTIQFSISNKADSAIVFSSITGLSVNTNSDLVYGGTIKFKILSGGEVHVLDLPLNIKTKEKNTSNVVYTFVAFVFILIGILFVYYNKRHLNKSNSPKQKKQ